MAAESPSAYLHFKLFALLFNGVALFLAAEIKELLITKLVNVFGSGDVDPKFIYTELHVKVYAFQEIVNILNISLALKECLKFFLLLGLFFIFVEVQLAEVFHQLFLEELPLIPHNTCIVPFGVRVMEEYASPDVVKGHHELQFPVQTRVVEPLRFALGVPIKERVLVQVIVERETFVFGHQSGNPNNNVRTVFHVEILDLDVDVGRLLTVWVVGVLKENAEAESICVGVEILGLFGLAFVAATK